MLASTPLHALCWTGGNAEIIRYQRMIDTNPKSALPIIQAQIAVADPRKDSNRAAWLYAMEAAAFSALESNEDERAAASTGLRYAPNVKDQAHAELAIQYSDSAENDSEIAKALGLVKGTIAAQTPNTAAAICLENEWGILERMAGQPGDAFEHSLRAYSASAKPGMEEQHATISWHLANAMNQSGAREMALPLVRKAIAWATQRGETYSLANSYYLQGVILSSLQRFLPAVAAFRSARTLSAQLGDTQGGAFAETGLCEAQIELAQLPAAWQSCNRARDANGGQNPMLVTKLLWLSARLDLASGNPKQALERMDKMLDRQTIGTTSPIVMKAYETRGLANAKLGRIGASQADYKEYARRLVLRSERERANQAIALHAISDFENQIARNAVIRSELTFAHERGREQYRRMVLTTAAATIIALLSAYILIMGRKHRRLVLGLAAEATAAAQTKADFLANMSHEIRGPIGNMSLLASSLRRNTTLPPAEQRLLDHLDAGARRVTQLLSEVLDFSKLEAGQIVLRPERFDLAALLAESVQFFAPASEKKELTLEMSYDPAIPSPIWADRLRIQQIIDNLLSNAINFTETGGVVLDAATEQGGMRIRISVSDTGIGMAPDQRDRLFQRFVQVDGAIRPGGGTGLGLAISRGLVELMAGEIAVTSLPGKGTTAWFVFPVATQPEAAPLSPFEQWPAA